MGRAAAFWAWAAVLLWSAAAPAIARDADPSAAVPMDGGGAGRPSPGQAMSQPLDIRPAGIQAAAPVQIVIPPPPVKRPRETAIARQPQEPAIPPPPVHLFSSAQNGSEKAAPLPPRSDAPVQIVPEPSLDPGAPPVEQYCAGIANAAADARFAWQKKVLEDTARDVDNRIAQLEAKIGEFKSWLARRDEFSRKAHETLISIYAKMKPETAALQLTDIDEETAAAVLTKLNPRTASVIMNEIPPGKAARLSAIIAGAAKVPEPKETGQQQKPQSGNTGAPSPEAEKKS